MVCLVLWEGLLNRFTYNIYCHFLTESEIDNASFLMPASHIPYFSQTSSAVAEMGDRLATINMGQKLGGCAPGG